MEESAGEHLDWELSAGDGEEDRTVRTRTSVARRGRKEDFGAITVLRDVTSEEEVDRMKKSPSPPPPTNCAPPSTERLSTSEA